MNTTATSLLSRKAYMANCNEMIVGKEKMNHTAAPFNSKPILLKDKSE